MAITRGTLQGDQPRKVLVAGSFGTGIVNANAAYTLPVASGTDIVVTSDSAGVAGNALDFQATDDGRTVNMGTATSDGTWTTVIRFNADGWSITLVPGSGGGEGCNIYEDTTNKVVTVMYEDGVTTRGTGAGNFEAVVATAASVSVLTSQGAAGAALTAAGGHIVHQEAETAATWTEESGTPSKTHLHFTDTVTTVTAAVASINGAYGTGTKTMTATGSGAHTVDNADEVAKQDLSGGVDAYAIATIKGVGFTPSQNSVGDYYITFDDIYEDCELFTATMQQNAVDDFWEVGVSWDLANNRIRLRTYENGGTAVADPAGHANSRIHFLAVMKRGSS